MRMILLLWAGLSLCCEAADQETLKLGINKVESELIVSIKEAKYDGLRKRLRLVVSIVNKSDQVMYVVKSTSTYDPKQFTSADFVLTERDDALTIDLSYQELTKDGVYASMQTGGIPLCEVESIPGKMEKELNYDITFPVHLDPRISKGNTVLPKGKRKVCVKIGWGRESLNAFLDKKVGVAIGMKELNQDITTNWQNTKTSSGVSVDF